jgi:thiol-disulfide isomerase/thioredoxin
VRVVRTKIRRWNWRDRRASPLVVLILIVAGAALIALLLPGPRLQPAATLSFALLDGRSLQMSELRGKPAIVTFWATTCAPCLEEVPNLIELYRDLHPRGLELIAVAMPYDPPLYVQALVRERALPYPVALDIQGEVWRAFDSITFIPTTFLLDSQGEVISRQVGKLDVARTRRLLEPFLNRS